MENGEELARVELCKNIYKHRMWNLDGLPASPTLDE